LALLFLKNPECRAVDIPKIDMEFAFRIKLMLGMRQKTGPLPQGSTRGFVSAAGGEIDGPLLQGRVVPNSGGDWALYRDDHTVMFTAHYMLEASDGTLIYMRNTGYRHASPEVAARQEALEPVDPSEYYMRVSPQFDTPVGPHDWLTRHVLIGTVQRQADHSVFYYYKVL
jgi:hypothetical protein